MKLLKHNQVQLKPEKFTRVAVKHKGVFVKDRSSLSGEQSQRTPSGVKLVREELAKLNRNKPGISHSQLGF